MKLGISTYTFTWAIGVPGYAVPAAPMSVIDLLHRAHQYGTRLVQIADNIPLHLMSDQDLQQLRDTAAALDIELEIGTRGTDPEHLLTYLRIAQFLGVTLFRTLITEPALDLAAEQLRQVLPSFIDSQVVIAIENHGLHTTKQLTALFEELDSPFVGSCLDTVNSFSALDAPDQVIRDLTPYMVNLHIKDFDITRVDHSMGFSVLGTAAGSGKLNIPDLLAHIQAANKSPNAILELWTPFTDSVEETIRLEQDWADQSIAYLRTLPYFAT